MNPFSSGTRLRDMIRSIRACKTVAEERAVVQMYKNPLVKVLKNVVNSSPYAPEYDIAVS
ncbi:unnamed protein product [Rhodiola kirilowii]